MLIIRELEHDDLWLAVEIQNSRIQDGPDASSQKLNARSQKLNAKSQKLNPGSRHQLHNIDFLHSFLSFLNKQASEIIQSYSGTPKRASLSFLVYSLSV